MNQNILKIVLNKEELFVPLLFTLKQFNILKKYDAHITLSNAEKKALYTSIKKKMEALNSIMIEQKDVEFYVNNPDLIIPERLKQAQTIIETYSKKYDKVFISGSFLFSKEYNDIDIFIMHQRGYKEEWNENKHIIFLSEKKLFEPLFQSASLISVSTFAIPQNVKKKKPILSEVMSLYHEAVIEYIKKDKKPEAMRRLIFDYTLFCHNKILNAKELNKLLKSIDISYLNKIIKEFCKILFSKSYLYV
ncbi:MAG: hypothetical protein AABX82_06435, partial [Nanoarchaeota archaeon]